MITSRNDFRQQAQAKLSNMVTKDKYQRALNAIEEDETKNCYQALGKAYILRKPADLKADYQSLIADNEKELKTIEVVIIFLSQLISLFRKKLIIMERRLAMLRKISRN